MNKITIAIIEDNRFLREGLKILIDPLRDISIVASYGTRGNIVQGILAKKPDVVLLDIGLQSQNSLFLAKTLKKLTPESRIIIMDILPAQSEIYAYVQAGVAGFVMKDASLRELAEAIRKVAGGSQVLPKQLTDSLFSQIVDSSLADRSAELLHRAIRMTRREREIITLVADGLTNKEIAQKLILSPYTVKSHIHNILEKLSLRTRVQIASFVHEPHPIPSSSRHPRNSGRQLPRQEN
jgi:DNA-binding NarL/FixJ family response regulator